MPEVFPLPFLATGLAQAALRAAADEFNVKVIATKFGSDIASAAAWRKGVVWFVAAVERHP